MGRASGLECSGAPEAAQHLLLLAEIVAIQCVQPAMGCQRCWGWGHLARPVTLGFTRLPPRSKLAVVVGTGAG